MRRGLTFGQAAAAADELAHALLGFSVRKAVDPLSPEGFLLISAKVADRLKNAVSGAEADVVRDVIHSLGFDWRKLSPEAADQAMKAVNMAIGKAIKEKVLPKVNDVLQIEGPKLMKGAKAAVIARERIQILADFNQRDRVAEAAIRSSQVNFIRDSSGRRAEALSVKARSIVADGMKQGVGTDTIAKDLREHFTRNIPRPESYWRTVADSFVGRARATSQIYAYENAGIETFEIVAVLDEVTTDQCRFMDGKVFTVSTGRRMLDAVAELDNSEDVKFANPWIRKGRNPDSPGMRLFVPHANGGTTTIASITKSGVGSADNRGTFSGGKDSAELSKLGIACPPFHGRCRTTLVAGAESADDQPAPMVPGADLQPAQQLQQPAQESVEQPEPASIAAQPPQPVAPRRPQVRAPAQQLSFPQAQVPKKPKLVLPASIAAPPKPPPKPRKPRAPKQPKVEAPPAAPMVIADWMTAAKLDVVKNDPAPGGCNGARLLTIQDGATTRQAIWKPASAEQSGLRPGIKGGSYYQREAALHELDFELKGGKTVVPSTVSRTHAGEEGSLQEFIPGTQPTRRIEHLLTSKLDEITDLPETRRMFLLDIIAANDDRHIENTLWTSIKNKFSPVAIDNGLTFPDAPCRFLFSIPEDKFATAMLKLDATSIEQLQALNLSRVAGILHKYPNISERQVTETLARIQSLQNQPDQLISQGAHGSYNGIRQTQNNMRDWLGMPAAKRVTNSEITDAQLKEIKRIAKRPRRRSP